MQQQETCEHNHEEIRRVFPEYLNGDSTDLEIIEHTIQGYLQLVAKYKNESSIMDVLEKKTIVLINATPSKLVVENYQKLLNQYFPHDIKKNYSLRMSRFFQDEDLPSLYQLYSLEHEDDPNQPIPWVVIQAKSTLPELKESLVSLFNFNLGRIANHEKTLLWFPDLLCVYQRVLNHLMQEQSTLPADWKYYIAILGVAIYGCEQLYHILVQQFMAVDGDYNWVECGSEAIPIKLRSLTSICKKIALTPWDSSIQCDLQKLMKCSQKNCTGQNCTRQWQRKELVHALCIFIFYNNLASYSMGVGVGCEWDLLDGQQSQNSSFRSQNPMSPRKMSNDDEKNKEVINMLKALEFQQEQYQFQENVSPPSLQQPTYETTNQEELTSELKFLKTYNDIFLKFVGNVEYIDKFTIERPSSILSSNFTFTLNGYPLLKEIVGDNLALKLFEFIQCVKYMTNESFHKEKINTFAFRNAVRLYVENINFYQHEGVNYKDHMNMLLKKELKTYIKLLTQNPSKITKNTISNIPFLLNPDEICHIALLSMGKEFYFMYDLQLPKWKCNFCIQPKALI